MMKLGIIGTGYVGLVAAAAFASKGHLVSCYDVDRVKLDRIAEGMLPFFEPGLQMLIEESRDRLIFNATLSHIAETCDLIFLCLPTPESPDGSPDLRALYSIAHELYSITRKELILVNKSTAPVGTARMLEKIGNGKFTLVANPEFLKEGGAVEDFLHPCRILIGLENPSIRPLLEKLYQSHHSPIHWMNFESAELAKYASNAMLACRISFMNELSLLAEKCGADIETIRHAMGADPRIGSEFLRAGIGFGGSCFPKDLSALCMMFEQYDLDGAIALATKQANTAQKEAFFQKILSAFPDGLENKKIVLWGLSFKPGTDDIRQAPSITLIAHLLKHKARLFAFDPVSMDAMARIYPDLTYANDPLSITDNADALICLTEWSCFKEVDLSTLLKKMRSPLFFDGRNFFDPAIMCRLGFTYHGIGRKIPHPEEAVACIL